MLNFKASDQQKVSFERSRLGFKRHFLHNSFQSSVPRGLRKQLFKKIKCHIGGGGGGSEKCQKSVKYYLNAPNL